MNALPANLIPDPSDSEDVVSALETADVFWTKGDADEAMRWLKRAAESASDAGNDARALAIARSVADLKSAPSRGAEAPSTSAKISRPPPPPSAVKAPPPPSAVRSGAQETSEVRRAPPSLPTPSVAPGDAGPVSKATSQKAPPPLPTAKPRESAVPPAPTPRHSSLPSAPTPKRAASTDRMPAVTAEPAPAAVAPTKAHPSTMAPSAAASAAVPETARQAPAAPHARIQPSAPSPVASVDAPVTSVRRSVPASSLPKEPVRGTVTPANAYRAVTVYVRPQARNGDKLEVFLAKPGQTPPPGTEPAILVPTRRGARLLG